MKHLNDLTRTCCRWIDEPPTLIYCGEVVLPGTSWCKVHFRQVFRPGPPTARRHPRLPIRLPVDLIPDSAPPDLVVEPPAPELIEVMEE